MTKKLTRIAAEKVAGSNDAMELAEQTKLVLRRMAKSVNVISSLHDGVRYAMAATAVDALSMNPPSMVISVNQAASIHPALWVGNRFCINILGWHQEIVARACGGDRKGEERFNVGEWDEGIGGVPMLRNAQANIICQLEKTLIYGSHCLSVGRIVEVHRHGGVEPLIYVDGRYTTTAMPN